MAYYLPSSDGGNGEGTQEEVEERPRRLDMTDLKIFWGPDICRLEYLLHLLDTGRIKDEDPVPGRARL